MRGIVTLAAALALPTGGDGGTAFPYRDLILFTAFSVVLGTLVLQGLTLRPLMERLRLDDDGAIEREVRLARVETLHAALAATAASSGTETAALVRRRYGLPLRRAEAELAGGAGGADGRPDDATELWDPRSADADMVRAAMAAERQRLSALRADGTIGDAAFQQIEQELDWTELDLQQLLRLEQPAQRGLARGAETLSGPGRTRRMRPSLRWPVLGVLAAIAITTAMDASGLSNFSALPLFPLMGLFWFAERLSRRSMGFVLGRSRHYGLAMLYPVLVLGAVALVATAAGALDVSQTDWKKAWINCAIVAASTVLVAILTEEGFFRGWLWASLERAGENQSRVLIWSSLAFSLWHLSAVTLETGFDLPAAQIPVFMINAAVLGAGWGLLRSLSGSVIVASLSHGLWNGIAYSFFGYGTKAGALGIQETALYGPEVGLLGLALNIVAVFALWRWWSVRGADALSPPSAQFEIPSPRRFF